MQTRLFDQPVEFDKDLDQHFTPIWAAEALIEEFFPDLDDSDLVLEPSCGAGHFLQALPQHVPAVGVEIDPRWVAVARRETGRTVVQGDFRTVELDLQPTAIIGNPPFDLDVVDGMLERAHRMLPEQGRVGWVLPAYAFQTPSRVVRYNEQWSLSQTALPRTLFPGLSKPLAFVLFSKDRKRQLVGFALYRQARDVEQMPKAYAEALRVARGSIWREAVTRALVALGGEASLEALYQEIGPKRPTGTTWWREKVRQIAQTSFTRVGPGRYAIPEAHAA
ncbi:SAM-dependent methyltransferase [Rhodovibrio sodomensis]|uniref:SAM-dependent methyltransferase n=1 Tax=Rhodovibrio sodomensis TaxID=1088 RepID=A0ABS1D873_9PROT|nr:hypothetical protein [Rhodovibrio sodomensis]MBK1666628.1 SAM-dependent methyltransferase [Rhodovibrio sodomensis]